VRSVSDLVSELGALGIKLTVDGERLHVSAPKGALTPDQPGGSGPPFFCVHGFGGGVLGYAELARQLGPEQPFYGLQAAGLNGLDEPDVRIEDMAARYLQAMRAVQPEGPYYLGGYCYGGIVAFEMARQLRTQGEHVALLANLKGYALRRSEALKQLWRPQVLARLLLNLPYWLRDALRNPGSYRMLLARLRNSLRPKGEPRQWDAYAEQVIAAQFSGETDVRQSYRKLMAVHLQAVRNYVPQAYQAG
jgi:thioesterase domain-containing protein